MKRIFLSALLCTFAWIADAQVIELKYFHGKQRCATRLAIEKHSGELLAGNYQKEMKQGKIKMTVTDISSDNGKKTARDYKVTWSSLFIVKGNVRKDLTRMAFQYARKEPEVFKKKLKEEIESILK